VWSSESLFMPNFSDLICQKTILTNNKNVGWYKKIKNIYIFFKKY
jgi:hypothetical protein